MFQPDAVVIQEVMGPTPKNYYCTNGDHCNQICQAQAAHSLFSDSQTLGVPECHVTFQLKCLKVENVCLLGPQQDTRSNYGKVSASVGKGNKTNTENGTEPCSMDPKVFPTVAIRACIS